jgi:hypothetical protein
MTFVKCIRLLFLYQNQKLTISLRCCAQHIPVCYVDLENCCSECDFYGFLQAVRTIVYMTTAIFRSRLMPFKLAFEIVSRNI